MIRGSGERTGCRRPRLAVSWYTPMSRAACIGSGSSLRFRLRLSAMIVVAGQNGRGPVNLFQKHDAYHLMRPSRGAERKLELGLAPQIGRKSVRAADQEKSVRDRLIAPAPKMPGKRRAVDAVPTFIERHQDRFFGNFR